jgi:hypothetical protein
MFPGPVIFVVSVFVSLLLGIYGVQFKVLSCTSAGKSGDFFLFPGPLGNEMKEKIPSF